jgi:hypothetical protein
LELTVGIGRIFEIYLLLQEFEMKIRDLFKNVVVADDLAIPDNLVTLIS